MLVFFSIQEHFKKMKTLQNFFRREFPKCDSVVTQAHRKEGRDTGRARGGLALLSMKSLAELKREKVETGGWRIQEQILHFGDWKLLWVNVYFPNDPKILNFDKAELLVAQTELQAVLDKGGYDGCMCSGDWN